MCVEALEGSFHGPGPARVARVARVAHVAVIAAGQVVAGHVLAKVEDFEAGYHRIFADTMRIFMG